MKIAISGKMCSGKTSFKDFLVKKFNNINNMDPEYNILPLKELSFGKPIKEMYNTYFPYNKIKDRHSLQKIGDTFREIDNDVFVNYLMDKCDDEKIIIIDDLRFKNEYTKLTNEEFICIRINIDEDTQRDRYNKLYSKMDFDHLKYHQSEIDLDDTIFHLSIEGNDNGFNIAWEYLIDNYFENICKVIFNYSAYDDLYNLELFTPCNDILTGKSVHRSCEWHEQRNRIYCSAKTI